MKKKILKVMFFLGIVIILDIANYYHLKDTFYSKEFYFKKTSVDSESTIEEDFQTLSIKNTKKSMVTVEAIFIDEDGTNQIYGSGVALYKSEQSVYICTSLHIVENADKIKLETNNGVEFTGNVIGNNANMDIAIIEAHIKEKDGICVAIIGDSDAMEEGSEVRIIGNALGNGLSITSGIISKKTDVYYENINIIQVDAAVNSGCSGGGLFNMSGELIGIVKSRVNDGYTQNIGLVIPINEIINFVMYMK